MALTYHSPGVYVIEQDTGARPIQAVGTSTAGFIGEAPLADAEQGLPVAVNSWAEFEARFVPQVEPGSNREIESTHLANAVQGFFLNGGGRCYIVNQEAGAPLADPLEALGRIDEIAILAAPGRTDIGAYNDLLASAKNLEDRVAVLDGPAEASEISDLTKVATSSSPAPSPSPSPSPATSDGDDEDGEGAAASPTPSPAPRPRRSSGSGGKGPPRDDKGYGAFYFPWLVGRDAVNPMRFDRELGRDVPNEVPIPPSGHVAGLYARTDSERGVHKAPANMTVLGATDLTQRISHQEQEVLNPEGVNCIRFFSREGIRVWGARTIAPGSSNWRYLPVRRLFNMVKESIAESTRWVVFEPNDKPLWKLIERDVSAFLNLLWRNGALAGATPEEAYFVRCDETTNPQESIDAGNVVTVIGIAPLKPAEFVIFKIGQTSQSDRAAA
ncbi:phage tail sheath subtilisin-like domain-containing protein [Erythrobacter sp. THAF29]|uniref:phage tail sheath family protein n=1 Tax=Erythrobacter sp. THAF29 TaxID=2587851 RepID=UPI001268F552|nr:phage tail sheath subtilisin-like domain-containing protein [Erythrobacter sp. THAF29]QFT76052.1 Phage tail sheath protein [Erythrobacter sp. THAF29]